MDRLSPKELKEYFAEHAVYETQMLYATCSLLIFSRHMVGGHKLNRHDHSGFTASTTSSSTSVTFAFNDREDRDWACENALLESFCIHARNLYNFLYRDKRYQNDVISLDYVENVHLWKRERPLLQSLKEEINRVSKEVVHITSKRLGKSIEQKKWRVVSIAKQIAPVLSMFMDIARPETIDESIRQILDQIDNLPDPPPNLYTCTSG